MLFALPGTTIRRTASKFLRDSSSFHVVLPGESGCRRNGVPDAWHETQRACPGRFARKIGWTLVLNTSKSSDAGGGGSPQPPPPTPPQAMNDLFTVFPPTSPVTIAVPVS